VNKPHKLPKKWIQQYLWTCNQCQYLTHFSISKYGCPSEVCSSLWHRG